MTNIHHGKILKKWLLNTDGKSEANQNTDPTEVQFDEPISFMEIYFRNMGEMYLQEQNWFKIR